MHAVAVRALRHHARPAARRLATQPCANTRVIAVVAHVDAGKTTLTEEMLNKAGVLRNSGRVDAGSVGRVDGGRSGRVDADNGALTSLGRCDCNYPKQL